MKKKSLTTSKTSRFSFKNGPFFLENKPIFLKNTIASFGTTPPAHIEPHTKHISVYSDKINILFGTVRPETCLLCGRAPGHALRSLDRKLLHFENIKFTAKTILTNKVSTAGVVNK